MPDDQRDQGDQGRRGSPAEPAIETPAGEPAEAPVEATASLLALARALPDRINADPEQVEQGLARLVLTVVELLREVLEHQAIRRMDGGTLTEEQVERLGLALLKLGARMDELKAAFGLTDGDLNIDLGPLGRLR